MMKILDRLRYSWSELDIWLRAYIVLVAIFVLGCFWFSGCGLSEAVRSGLTQGGTGGGEAAAKVLMDRLPEVTPEFKAAIIEAVESGVRVAVAELGLKNQQSNGWLSSLLSGGAVVLAYILSRRFAWARAVIDFLKGLPNGNGDTVDSKNKEKKNVD